VVPDFCSPQRFTCMVNVITGPVEVGMNVAGAAVSAGSVLTSASELPVGFISIISIPKSDDSPKNSGAPKLNFTPQAFASSRQDVLVEIIVTDPPGFTFPSLVEEAARYAGLVRKIEDASASSASDEAARLRLRAIIAKLNEKPPKKLSNDDVEFCRKACGLSDEECKLLPSNLATASSAGGASPAADKTPTSAKKQDSTKTKFAAAGGGGKSSKPDSKPSDTSPRDTERKLPVALTLDASASSASRTESRVPPPTAPMPPQGAAPTSGACTPQAHPSSSQADDWLGVSDEALAKYLSKN
jgi:hypothetical protein